MAALEVEARALVRRLKQDGWTSDGGTKHEKFRHIDRPGEVIMVPRHRVLSPGVARSIARAAGWI